MPTYEYRCPKGHTFEVFQKMSDLPVATCTHCGEPAERVVSGGAGFLFKGEGFYITDSRSADYKKKAEAESGITGGKPKQTGGPPEPSPKFGSSGSDKGSRSGSDKGSRSESDSGSGSAGGSGASGSGSSGASGSGSSAGGGSSSEGES